MIDCHGKFTHFENLHYKYNPEETAIIILGDVGLNVNLDINDWYRKRSLDKYGFNIYCIRGNHEYSPNQIYSYDMRQMALDYKRLGYTNIEYQPTLEYGRDTEVDGTVFVETQFPKIRYLEDGKRYNINGNKTLVLGGAYSIDAEYRKSIGAMWNSEEQISEDKRKAIMVETLINPQVDLVLSHTCPLDWRPTDLFLKQIDQSKVDTTTETFLQNIEEIIHPYYKAWCWGHFHETRWYNNTEEYFKQNRVMIYNDFIPLEEIVN